MWGPMLKLRHGPGFGRTTLGPGATGENPDADASERGHSLNSGAGSCLAERPRAPEKRHFLCCWRAGRGSDGDLGLEADTGAGTLELSLGAGLGRFGGAGAELRLRLRDFPRSASAPSVTPPPDLPFPVRRDPLFSPQRRRPARNCRGAGLGAPGQRSRPLMRTGVPETRASPTATSSLPFS